MAIRYLEPVELDSPEDEVEEVEISEEEAIKQMREVHNTSPTSNHKDKCSCSDEILLDDFITVNWAWRV